MKFYRLECYDEDGALVAIREVPMKAETQRAIKAMHTRLLNWAFDQHFLISRTKIYHIERN